MTPSRESKITSAVQNYRRRIMGFIRARVRNEFDAEDLMQEVWLQLSRVADIDQIEELGAWLFRVARSKIIDRSRKKLPVPVSSLPINDDQADSIEDLLFLELETPESETLRVVMWEEFWIALGELPPEQRDVFVWNELDDLTFDEISKRTGVNPKTLISRKRYAVQKLRKRLALLRSELTQ
ncbi:MAG: sigma-70 family RNA polymerase sigma factor [Calditrichaeota bacterium]|nr:sigma-70 family RNA polymerase sigma factor [Calditrichota bacterium]